MLAAHEQRFSWIYSDYLERPAGDYAELLRRGAVSSPDGVDPEAWREEIRRQARHDKVRVMSRRDGDRAYAVLNRAVPQDQEAKYLEYEFKRMVVMQELDQRTRALGHKPIGWLRHDEESVSFCQHCLARIYVRLGAETVEDGEALSDPCAGEPPYDSWASP